MRSAPAPASGTVGMRPDVGSYDALLPRFLSARREEEALELFECMLADGIAPIEHHFRLAVGACAALGHAERAAELLLEMQARVTALSPWPWSGGRRVSALRRVANVRPSLAASVLRHSIALMWPRVTTIV